jgi:hypothetical protein
MSDLNIKSTTVEKGLDLLKGFIEKTMGPSLEEFGLSLSDGLKIRRLKNQLKNLQRAKEIAEAHHVTIKQINLKALFPYLEGAALEEDETLQEMWANLFVNYIDTEKNLTLTVFPDLLKHLSSNEVNILAFMMDNKGYFSQPDIYSGTKDFSGTYLPEELDNLLRLELIHEMGDYSIYGENKIEELQPKNYYLTNLGDAFLSACRR